jgi:hypothetical protein
MNSGAPGGWSSAGPPATKWFDVSKVNGYFRGNPYFGLNTIRLIDQYVQNEPVQEFDKAMHGMLAHIGIVKGQVVRAGRKDGENSGRGRP